MKTEKRKKKIQRKKRKKKTKEKTHRHPLDLPRILWLRSIVLGPFILFSWQVFSFNSNRAGDAQYDMLQTRTGREKKERKRRQEKSKIK